MLVLPQKFEEIIIFFSSYLNFTYKYKANKLILFKRKK